GVQTCALPISADGSEELDRRRRAESGARPKRRPLIADLRGSGPCGDLRQDAKETGDVGEPLVLVLRVRVDRHGQIEEDRVLRQGRSTGGDESESERASLHLVAHDLSRKARSYLPDAKLLGDEGERARDVERRPVDAERASVFRATDGSRRDSVRTKDLEDALEVKRLEKAVLVRVAG